MTAKPAACRTGEENPRLPLNIQYEHHRKNHCHCIVCGNANPASLHLKFRRGENGCVTASFRGNELLQGYTGILHGGIISSLLDAAMTHCLFHEGIRAVTGDLSVRFLHPVPWDAPLEIHAKIVANHRILYHLESEPDVVNNDGMKRARVRQLWLRRDFYGLRRTHRSLYPEKWSTDTEDVPLCERQRFQPSAFCNSNHPRQNGGTPIAVRKKVK
jgi:acyl-coenzyme A thioesterase PaaI-like protein